MLACIGLGSPDAKVGPSGPLAVSPLDPAPPAAPLLDAASLDPAAPLEDMSSSDAALALASARALCARTGGTGQLAARVQLLGGKDTYAQACGAEMAAGAAARLLACLSCHAGRTHAGLQAHGPRALLEAVALCVRNLCALGEHGSDLFSVFEPLADSVDLLAVDAAAGSAADAVWMALGNLLLNGSTQECYTALRLLPSAAERALSACAARQGQGHPAAFSIAALCYSAARSRDAGLRKRIHATTHACLPPLLAILCCSSTEAATNAARALTALFKLKAACPCNTSPCAQCSLAAPTALTAVAQALACHSASGSMCKQLVDLLCSMQWETCEAFAEVQRALEALLARLHPRAPAAACPYFTASAASVISRLACGRHWQHWQDGALILALAPLTAALRSGPCTHLPKPVAELCRSLGNLTFTSSTRRLRNCVQIAMPAVAAALLAHQGSSIVAASAAFFFNRLLWAANFTARCFFCIPGPKRHWSIFIRMRTALLPLLPVLLRAMTPSESGAFLKACQDVPRLISTALSPCRLGRAHACSECLAIHTAWLATAPHVLSAMEWIAANSAQGAEAALAGSGLVLVLFAIIRHLTGAARSALVQSALQPLVALIAAFAADGITCPLAMEAVADAAVALLRLLDMERSSAGAPPSAAAGAAPPPQPTMSALRAHHLPALQAAAARLQEGLAPPPLLRLLKLLGSGFVLLHLPAPEALLRLSSCLQCWQAQPRQPCLDAAAHGELLECAICREEERDGAAAALQSMLVLHCGHLFHRHCLLAWLTAGGRAARAAGACCPLDRAPITRVAAAGDEGAPGCLLIEAAAGAGEGEEEEEEDGEEGEEEAWVWFEWP